MNYLKVGAAVGLVVLTLGQPLLAASAKGDHSAPLVSHAKVEALRVPSNITLDDAVQIALKQNPQVLAAIQQIEQTRGQVISVRAQALPNVALSSAYNQQDPKLVGSRSGTSSNSTVTTSGTSGTTGTATGTTGTSSTNTTGTSPTTSSQGLSSQDKSWNVTVQATQLLYSGGVGAAIKIAKLTLDSNYYSLRDVVDQTIATVRQQFYDVLLNRALIAVQEESVNLLETQLKDQKNRFDAGTVPRFNVLQAEVALANQLPQLIRARNTYLISELTLARTLGVEYDAMHPGKPAINPIGDLTVHERSVNEAEAVRLAKERRSFLKVQRQSILIQLQQIKVQLAGYQPTLSANAGYELRNSPFSTKLDDVVNGWFFGVSGNWAIFDGFATYGKVKTARAQLETAKVNYDDAVLQVELQVQQALANLRQAEETIESQSKSVEEALEAVRLAQERLAAGAGVQLDILNAQVALLTARTNELQAKHDYNVAQAQFEYAIGAQTQYADTFDDPLTHKRRPITATSPKD